MKIGSSTHKFWLWYYDKCWMVVGKDVSLPTWPWKIYCMAKGHSVVDDQCGIPTHRYCWVCEKIMPYAQVEAPE